MLYLCASCEHMRQLWDWAGEVDCGARPWQDSAKGVADHGGDPLEVCPDYAFVAPDAALVTADPEGEGRRVRELVHDALSTILGWAWVLNEVAGHDKYDTSTPPMRTFFELQARARVLGVDE